MMSLDYTSAVIYVAFLKRLPRGAKYKMESGAILTLNKSSILQYRLFFLVWNLYN